MNTKTLLTAVSLAALVATPAFAQKTHRAYNAYNQGAYASSVEPGIVENGRVIATDPDAAIRSELQRDATTYTSTN
jgi:hypothetical protein